MFSTEEDQLSAYRQRQREEFLRQKKRHSSKTEPPKVTEEMIVLESDGETESVLQDSQSSESCCAKRGSTNPSSQPFKRSRGVLPRIVDRDPRIEWLLGRSACCPDGAGMFTNHDVIGECHEVGVPTLESLCGKVLGLRLLSWNLDGLDENGLHSRTLAALQTILGISADVVFLQEVVDGSFALIGKHLKSKYHVIIAEAPDGRASFPYYCAILLSKIKFGESSDRIENVKVQWFESSQMGRHILSVRCAFPLNLSSESGSKVAKICFLTSHLESCVESANERTAQLEICWKRMHEVSKDCDFVIFGGDLNLRDREAAEARHRLRLLSPEGPEIVDAWECLGKDPVTRYTWDLVLNDNKSVGSYKPRMRFDRIYFCSSDNSTSAGSSSHAQDAIDSPSWKPINFRLVGHWRLRNGRFPSDHFGLLVDFAIMNAVRK